MKKHLTKQQVLAYRRKVLAGADELRITVAAKSHIVYSSTIFRWRKVLFP